MLTPNQLDKLPEPMIQLMSELQDEIISDICRRIQKTKLLTPTAEWQLEKANQLTISSREVKRRIASKLKVQEKLINKMYLVLKETSESGNIYDEYLYINGAYELIGSTAIDLSGYVKSSDLHALTTAEINTIITNAKG